MTIYLLSALALFVPNGEGAAVYASPSGSEHASGTQSAPYSLSHALNLATNEEVTELILLDGEYELEDTLILSSDHSRRATLTVRAQTPGKATLSGSIKLQSSVPSAGKIQRYAKPDDPRLHASRDLFIGNQRATRARSITYEAWDDKFSAIPGLTKLTRDSISSEIHIEPGTLIHDHTRTLPPFTQWENPEDIEFVFRCAWWEKRCGVDSVGENRLTFQEPGWSTLNTLWGSETSSRLNALMPKSTVIEGAIELLDSPGEWHNGNEFLSLIPLDEAKPNEQEIRLARLQTLLRIENAARVRFEGITFAHTTWLAPIKTKGFNEGQANFEQIGQIGRPSEAIGLYQAENVTFEGCTFKNLGGWGLGIFQSSRNITVNNCKFIDIAGNGIVVGSVSDEEALGAIEPVSDVTISNSLVHKPASVYHGGVGIFVGHASRVSILRNEVCHAPYTGISIGWGWNTFDSTEIETHGNRVIDNHVHHYLYQMYDGGGIYTLGPQSNSARGIDGGLVIERNFVHNQGGIGNILYSDGGSRWIRIQHNTTSNNLKELEDYYEQKAMYVPDWGGCGPYGNLVFSHNTLGNVAMRSPNFRCAPADPEPWSESFELPPNTLYEENKFEAYQNVKEQADASLKHRNSNLKPAHLNAIKSFTTQASDVEFTLFTDSQVEITTEAIATPISLISLATGELAHIHQTEKSAVFLREGSYKFGQTNQGGFLKQPQSATTVSTQHGNITSIQATGGKIEIDTGKALKRSYLAYSVGTHPEELFLRSGSLSQIKKSGPWTDQPFHWQALRAFIDINAELPSVETRAILYELPQGTFTIDAAGESSKTTLAVSVQTTGFH